MNSILRKTHAKDYIDIMRARDYYYNRAKKLYFLKSAIVIAVPFFMGLSYLPIIQNWIGYEDTARDIATGFISLSIILLSAFFDGRISELTETSNMLREYYDWKIFDFPCDCFIYDTAKVNSFLNKPIKVKYEEKYKTWYAEIFSDNHLANVICCQLDNILYSMSGYNTTKKVYCWFLCILIILALGVLVIPVCSGSWLPVLFIFFSFMQSFDIIHSIIKNLTESYELCNRLKEQVMNLDQAALTQENLIALQHGIIANRALCIFIPKKIRDALLEDNPRYVRELNDFRKKFYGNYAEIPENDTQIDVVSRDGTWGTSLSEIHNHLREMMKEVVAVFKKENIHYMLDGGTLIGAKRPSVQGFIAWDDDIDLSIPLDQLNAAKIAIQTHLPHYHIQDFFNEPFYSPRLAAFRIREDDSISQFDEQDSALYVKYKRRGLFIDVYVYSPIVHSQPIDKAIRKVFFHPINKRMRKMEQNYAFLSCKQLIEKRFIRLKSRYLRRLGMYHKLAKNTAYYAYSPEYIHDYKKAGPYHKAEELYGQKPNYTIWEGISCRIPNKPETVLPGYYGDNWETAPYSTKAELQQKNGAEWMNYVVGGISSLKHITNVVHLGDSYNKN